jgi:predicted DNA-binding protein
MEATVAVSADDLDKMSRDQVVEWFKSAPDEELAEVVRTARQTTDGTARVPRGESAIPLMLTSLRLPVELVSQLDEVAAVSGLNRSEAIRAAVVAYVQERRGEVSATEAEHALEVLRRVVGEHIRDQAA